MRKGVKIYYTILVGLFIILVFVSYFNNKSYWENQKPINKEDSIEIIVKKDRDIRGTMSFNKAFYLNSSLLTKKSRKTFNQLNMKYPYKLHKKYKSDTIFLQNHDTLIYLVFHNYTSDSIYDPTIKEALMDLSNKSKKQ